MNYVIAIGVVDLVVLGLGIVSTRQYGLACLSFAVPAIGIITFFGMLYRSEHVNGDQSLRRAIAVAIVTVYLVMVGVASFFRGDQALPEIAQRLLESFTYTVGVVIAFYFGSSAYVEAAARRAQKDDRPNPPGA